MGKKLLVGSGGLMLMSVLLLAAFSLGVYAGRGDLLDGSAPPIAGPVQQPRQPQPNPQPQQPTLNSQPKQPQPVQRPILVGRVRSMDPGGLVVETNEGLRHVLLSTETRYRWPGEEGQPPQPASYADVQPGMRVAVFGRPSENGRGLVANVIEILPKP